MAGPTRPRAVLVMARRDAAHGELLARLGLERWAELHRLLLRRAIRWAESVDARSVSVAYSPDMRTLLGREVDGFALNGAGATGELATAAARALGGADAPLLIAWPELPVWRADHADAALDDLADGCQVSIGPVFDGGFYLVALAHPFSGGLGLPAAAWRSADALALTLAAAHGAGIQAGLLRPERGLRTVADVRAALADPLLDEELRALLEPCP